MKRMRLAIKYMKNLHVINLIGVIERMIHSPSASDV